MNRSAIGVGSLAVGIVLLLLAILIHAGVFRIYLLHISLIVGALGVLALIGAIASFAIKDDEPTTLG